MENTQVERWQELYEKARLEKDPQKLSELVYEIHRLLREKEDGGVARRQTPKEAV